MSRFIKPKHDYHSFCLREDSGRGNLVLVGSGRAAYLWAESSVVLTFSGRKTLRKLAKLILATIPERKAK